MTASEEAKSKGKVWTKIILCKTLDKMGSFILCKHQVQQASLQDSEIQGTFTPIAYMKADLNIILRR